MGRPDVREIFQTDIYALTGEEFSRGRSNIGVIKDMIAAGIKIIQYREKEKKMRRKYQECLELRRLTREAGVTFIVNDDVDLAMLVEADGVHIGQDDLPPGAVRRLVGPDTIIGLSTHSPQQAQEALKSGVDYIGVGPIFPTSTKKDVVDPVGLAYLEYVVRHIPLPFVAIGGIKEHNIRQVRRKGARCIAMVTEILEAEEIVAKVKRLRAAMEGTA
ncbi:thiamine-phosphate pyrophosphorylase [Clostridiales bacterium PH28_bin88]|nr:thiamine-phosphate pyrophosphorylase [Clostridiales bacterium PH28_bin88]